MFRKRENLRGSVPDSVLRRIDGDAKARGVSRLDWVGMAATAYLEPPKKPTEPAKGVVRVQVPVGLGQALDDLQGVLMRLRSKSSFDIDSAIGQVGKVRNLLK